MKKLLALGAMVVSLTAPVVWAESIPLLGDDPLPGAMATDANRLRLTVEEKAAMGAILLRQYKEMTPAERDRRYRNMLELANSLSPETVAKFRAYAIGKLATMPADKREKLQARFEEKWGELDATQRQERRAEAQKRYHSATADEQEKFKGLLPKIHAALIGAP